MPNVLSDYNAASPVAYTTSTATIALGQSLSGAVKIAGLRVLGIIPPVGMTGAPAPLTFQGSVDGVSFFDLYNSSSAEITAGSYQVSAARYQILTPNELAGLAYIKVRTGGTATPQAQAAQQVLTVVLGL